MTARNPNISTEHQEKGDARRPMDRLNSDTPPAPGSSPAIDLGGEVPPEEKGRSARTEEQGRGR